MNDFVASILLLGALNGGSYLPFWAASNNFGIMPQGSGGLALVQAYSLPTSDKAFTWEWGTSLGANVGGGTNTLLVDELYAGVSWKNLGLNLGMKHFDRDYLAGGVSIGHDNSLGSISSTGGHLIWTGNARTMPGYSLTLSPFPVPFTSRHIWVYGSYGDYMAMGSRYVDKSLVHSTRAFFKFVLTNRIDFEIGLDHYAVWGGKGEYVTAPQTFSNYLRMIIGMNAGADGSAVDRANCIGDQGGSELLKLTYRGDAYHIFLQHDIPYNDGSGMMLKNFPDGVNTICFSFLEKDRWVSDILYEYSYSMYQSGSISTDSYDADLYGPLPPEGDSQGGDDYFNNGQYADGWIHMDRVIGYPLFFPKDRNADGLVLGVKNNRLKAHHFGLTGKLFRKAPYKLMLTYSMNHGIYQKQFTGEQQWQHPWKSVKETGLPQFSAAFMGEVPLAKGLAFTYGLYADKGKVLDDQFGATAGLRWLICSPRE